MTELYPLRFREILRDYSFGGRWIPRVFAKDSLPEDHRIAETWEVCDRPGESSRVINGPLAGQTLHSLIELHGERLLGRDVAARFGRRFPLLIKFLDCTNPLSEQAHHSDTLARERGLSDPGKTEAWCMLRVREGATIRCGNRAGLSRDELRDSLLEGRSRECMQEHEVRPGDSFLLYAGTMHYAAGGVLFYEIMQNSDVYISLGPPPEELADEDRLRAVEEAVQPLKSMETSGSSE